MGIQNYDYVDKPGVTCRQCGCSDHIVEDLDGFICSDCLFENNFWEHQAEARPRCGFVFGDNDDE